MCESSEANESWDLQEHNHVKSQMTSLIENCTDSKSGAQLQQAAMCQDETKQSAPARAGCHTDIRFVALQDTQLGDTKQQYVHGCELQCVAAITVPGADLSSCISETSVSRFCLKQSSVSPEQANSSDQMQKLSICKQIDM